MSTLNICDFCESPIKKGEAYSLSIAYEGDKASVYTAEDYKAYVAMLERNIKHICPNCNILLAELFRIKKSNLHEVNKDLFAMWSKPSKEKANVKNKRRKA